MKKGMKSLSLIVVLSVGVIAMVIALVPVGITTDLEVTVDRGDTTLGNLKVAEITVRNAGLFTRVVDLPQIAACIGDEQIVLDSVPATNEQPVRGAGQMQQITVRPGESGVIHVLSSEGALQETMLIYYDEPSFSCLTAQNPLNPRS